MFANLKEDSYLIMILGLLILVGYAGHRVERMGEEHEIALQQKADAKEAEHVAKVAADANDTIKDLQTRFAAVLAAPVEPPFVVRVCPSTPAAPSTHRPDSADAPSYAAGRSSGGVGNNDQAVDIAPATETILRRDKAMIDYLQGYIRACQKAGVCQQGPS